MATFLERHGQLLIVLAAPAAFYVGITVTEGRRFEAQNEITRQHMDRLADEIPQIRCQLAGFPA